MQFQRNTNQELLFVNKVKALGLVKTETNLFKLQLPNDPNNPFEAVEYITEHHADFIENGFSLDLLSIDGKKMQTKTAIMSVLNEEKTDWFDLKIIISCGQFEINFTEIIPNLKQRNRLFQLPDHSFFLIPIEWMSKYESLLKFSTIKGNQILLPKINYTLLENLTDNNETVIQQETIPYQSSPLLKATLRPYQEEGVKWLLKNYQNGMGSCLADDMGLGKTIQTLAMLVAVQQQLQFLNSAEEIAIDLFGEPLPVSQEKMRVLIVLPSSLVFNWYNESKKFTPHFSCIQYVGNERKLIAKKLHRYDLVFTSYSIISRDIALFEKHNFRFLILDESQNIKNRKSETFKAINRINASNKISISGTPIENSLSDLWSQMEFVNPNVLGTYRFFETNFKIPIEKNKDQDCLLALRKIIQPFILRRTKEEVLDDLPEMVEQIYYCDMEPEQEKLYELEKSKARNLLLKINSPLDKLSTINTLMRLRQLSNHPKMVDKTSEIDSGKYLAVTSYLKTLVEANQKTIIFSSFVTNLAFYKTWCNDNQIEYCELIGSTSQEKREVEVNRFQEQEKPLLFFISLKAGGVGLNITRASQVLFLDPWWNPFSEKQGIGRAHRIGQLNKVNVVRFISRNTVEEKIINLQKRKKFLSDSLLEADYLDSEIIENINYLLE
ncbi:SNF2 family DNA or RNA helicase [Flavobacterium sp. PL11]|uniref:DEAD/DEAH box helicase n=1 Tax=Flavobacterium sp. PL11 TaxID=3071717 RepID=UPI002DFF4DC1|nr:SNF2 family DNA or RNA helicase [Flavobacterium sp. PL11]